MESNGQNESCPGETVEFECNIPFTKYVISSHRWRIIFEKTSVDDIVANLTVITNEFAVIPPFTFNVTQNNIVNGSTGAIVSTATTTATAQINRTTVSCEDGGLISLDPNPSQLTLIVVGKYMCTLILIVPFNVIN